MDIGASEGGEQLVQREPYQEDFLGDYENWNEEDSSVDAEWPDDYEDNYDFVFALEDDSWWTSEDSGSLEEDSWWTIDAESQTWPQEVEVVQQTAATSSSGPVQSVSTIASTFSILSTSCSTSCG